MSCCASFGPSPLARSRILLFLNGLASTPVLQVSEQAGHFQKDVRGVRSRLAEASDKVRQRARNNLLTSKQTTTRSMSEMKTIIATHRRSSHCGVPLVRPPTKLSLAIPTVSRYDRFWRLCWTTFVGIGRVRGISTR